MASNPYQTKRIQVVFDQETRDAVEAFAADRGLTLSKATAFLAKEALLARGQLQTEEEANRAEAFDAETTRMSIATDKKIADKQQRPKSMLEQVIEETGATGTLVSRKTERLATEDAQMLKLKLMQELMEQLKSV